MVDRADYSNKFIMSPDSQIAGEDPGFDEGGFG